MLEGGRQRREAGVDLDHRVTAAQPSRVCGSAAREERRRPDDGHQDVIAAFVSALPCPLWWRQGVGGAAEDAWIGSRRQWLPHFYFINETFWNPLTFDPLPIFKIF